MEIINIIQTPVNYLLTLNYCKLGEARPFVHRHLKAMIYEIERTNSLIKDVKRFYSESDYKVGLRTIRNELEKQNIHINFRQIRRLIRPNTKKNHHIKISYSSHDIFTVIKNLIDSQPVLKEKCIAKRNRCGHNNKSEALCPELCKNILIGYLSAYLNQAAYNLKPDGMELCNRFVEDQRMCTI